MSIETKQLSAALELYEQDDRMFGKGTFREIRHPNYQGLYYRDEVGTEYEFDLINELRGKVAGDVGSGAGGLALTAAMEGLDSEIWSIHPHMREDAFMSWQRQEGADELLRIYPHSSHQARETAQKIYESRAIRGFAHSLSEVSNEFFEALVDSYAAHQYMSRTPGVYEASICEMLRVLKPGGKIVVFGGLSPLVTDFPNLPSSDFREKTLRKLDIPFTALYKKASNEKPAVGALIYKPI